MQTTGLLRRKPPLLAMTCRQWFNVKTSPVVIASLRSNPAQRLRCEKRREEEGGIMLESLEFRAKFYHCVNV